MSCGEITVDLIAALRADFGSNPSAKVAQNAVCGTAINVVALNRQVVQDTELASFSCKVDSWSVTNQKSSGRCWLFATLNVFRINAMKVLNVKDFEFSQSYVHFWDKFERSNHFLEAVISTAGRPLDDRTVAYMLGDPIGDGGQWDMAINLIRKHGLVPKSVYPESVSSSATLHMNRALKNILRTAARELRTILAEPTEAVLAEARAQKEKRLKDIWCFLCIHLGTPPQRFRYSWTDKSDVQHRVKNGGEVTPLEFCEMFVGNGACDAVPPAIPHYSEYVCLVNDPRNSYMQTFTVDFLQSVTGGPPVVYLNVSTAVMRDMTRRQLEDGLGVWMGCDVGQCLHRDTGIWDLNIFEDEELYGFNFGMGKADRLLYGESLMTHAMMFTGVDLCDGVPMRWRVENSWGDGSGKKGFYTMNDNWFDEYMFEIAVPRRYLSADLLECLSRTPVVLPAWDPMGSLARVEAFHLPFCVL